MDEGFLGEVYAHEDREDLDSLVEVLSLLLQELDAGEELALVLVGEVGDGRVVAEVLDLVQVDVFGLLVVDL